MPGKKKFKFPDPKSCKPENPAVLCTAERLLALYNQSNSTDAKKVAKQVRAWFAKKAKEKGWAGVQFLPENQTGHSAGCVLWLPPSQVNVQILITNEMFVLKSQSD